jgi:hypothetical protein
MAAPQAYEQPTLNMAWDAFLGHIPTVFLIWAVSVLLAVIGFGVSMFLDLIGIEVVLIRPWVGFCSVIYLVSSAGFRSRFSRVWWGSVCCCACNV